MNLWINYQEFTEDEHLGIIIASSDNDFIEYNIETAFKKSWRELKLKLNKNSSGEYEINKSAGTIDLKRIKYIKIIIYGNPGNNGKIWINEIYLSEPNILKENAHLFQGEIEITKPLYKLESGVPILSDIKIKYIKKGHGRSFATIGKIKNKLEEKKKQLYTSMSILPQWKIINIQ